MAVVGESNLLWDASWFLQDEYICEYAAIHAPLLDIYQYGMPNLVSSLVTTRGLDMITREPFGLPASIVDPNDFFLQQACSVMPCALEVGQFAAVMDSNGTCCIDIAGGSIYWWIHASKLCLIAPKSKRRGLASNDKRHLTVVGLVTLSDAIMKQVCGAMPGLSVIPTTTLTTILASLWLQRAYAQFCLQMASRVVKREAMLLSKLPEKVGTLVAACAAGVVPCDVTWFSSRLNVWHKLDSAAPRLPLSLIYNSLVLFASKPTYTFAGY